MEAPIIENLKTVCICRNIKKGTILKAIKEGSLSVEAVNRKTGVGRGDCKGERCGPKIREMIEEFQKKG